MTLEQLFKSEPTNDDIMAFARGRGQGIDETAVIKAMYQMWFDGQLDVRGNMVKLPEMSW